MSALYLVVPLALLFAMLAIWAFVWSARSGQFDDLDGPAERILHDDDGVRRHPLESGESPRLWKRHLTSPLAHVDCVVGGRVPRSNQFD
jgi:cbb3-type cytochrome oxidase maturation protein